MIRKRLFTALVMMILAAALTGCGHQDEISADGYAPDAASAVDLVKGLLG